MGVQQSTALRPRNKRLGRRQSVCVRVILGIAALLAGCKGEAAVEEKQGTARQGRDRGSGPARALAQLFRRCAAKD